MTPEDLLEKLHDIEGLDNISFWPLAIGWWILIGVGFIALLLIVFMGIRYIRYKRSWKNDTLKKLTSLETHLTEKTSQPSLLLLSEYLRRIVLKKFSRKECAGLVGDEWLKWLSKHDPKQFNWESKGMLLLIAPYAPATKKFSIDQIKELIQAVRNWVH